MLGFSCCDLLWEFVLQHWGVSCVACELCWVLWHQGSAAL